MNAKDYMIEYYAEHDSYPSPDEVEEWLERERERAECLKEWYCDHPELNDGGV